jgi:phosphoribosylformylglycinamidine (FGAM) synthase-like enzyme
MALAGGMGARVSVPAAAPLAPVLFGEDQGRYLVTTDDPDSVMAAAQAHGVFAAPIGSTGGDAIVVEHRTSISVSLAALRRAHEGFFPQLMRGEPAVT